LSREIIKDNRIISHFTQRVDKNFSFTRDPDKSRVITNFVNLADKLNLNPENYVCARQTHGIEVGVVTKEHVGTGVYKDTYFTNTDALITNIPGITLLTVHADCIPVQLFDPANLAVATIHSGWKGTFGEIAFETVEAMKKHYNTDPSKLIAAIGPGICQQCFEISEDVYVPFCEKFPELSADSEYIYPGKIPGKWHLNLKAFVFNSLVKAGVLPENIDNTLPCTCCCEEEFFSHRRDSKKAQAGENVTIAAMGSLICIKE